MDWLDISAETGLLGLFAASFLAATLLPGGSEAVLFAFLRLHPEQQASALLLATLGNTLGGLTSWACGRWLPCTIFMAIGKFARYWLVAQGTV